VVGIDASGSVDDNLLAQFASEAASMGRRTGAEVWVVVFDTGIMSVTKMEGLNWDSEITQVPFARGGGTSFVDVIAKGVELNASIIVVLTDLFGPHGPEPKGIPVVWATPDDKVPAGFEPPFGKVLSLAR
jgi:predicted metal-dependent peptidase